MFVYENNIDNVIPYFLVASQRLLAVYIALKRLLNKRLMALRQKILLNS